MDRGEREEAGGGSGSAFLPHCVLVTHQDSSILHEQAPWKDNFQEGNIRTAGTEQNGRSAQDLNKVTSRESRMNPTEGPIPWTKNDYSQTTLEWVEICMDRTETERTPFIAHLYLALTTFRLFPPRGIILKQENTLLINITILLLLLKRELIHKYTSIKINSI